MQELDCCLSLDQGPMGKMKSWVGIGEGRVRKSVCCVGMSVKVLVIHCGIVQY